MRRAFRIVLVLLALDVAAVVVSGGVSLVGPTSDGGLLGRVVLLAGLVLIEAWPRRKDAAVSGYIVLLLLLVPLLHARGYRLRGDGLWYYSLAHSIAFDGDLDPLNDYRALGIDGYPGSQPVPQTGRGRFTYPVGAPMLWVPFVELGHAGAALRNAYGLATRYDGFSDPYFHAVALGNLLFGWAGLLVLDRLLRRWFSPFFAFVATAGIGLATFLTWYLAYHAIYTHALTFLFVTLFVKRWVDGPEGRSSWAVLGLLLGLACTVRWQNAVFALLPAVTLASRLRERGPRRTLATGGVFSLGVILGVLPQIASWKLIFDRFYLGVPLGPGYVRWGDPFLTEVLFSSRHGLFTWSPILYAAAIGLLVFAWRHRREGLPLLAVTLVVWYVNSTVADWWGGGAFGARRFDSVLPMLGLGLATALVFVDRLVRRHPRIVTGGLVAAAALGNGLLMEQYRKGRLPVDDTISWETAARGELEDVFDAVGYPLAFPMNWIFAWRYDRPKTQYDLLVGKYLFHRMHGLGGVIELGPSDPPFLGNGWTGLKDWEGRPRDVRFALGPRAGILVPVDQPESLRLFVACAAVPGEGPVPIEVRLNGERLAAFSPTDAMSEHAMTIDRRFFRRINLVELVALEDVGGKPFLAVDRLRFEQLD